MDVADKPTYRQRLSKVKAQQQISSSMEQVDDECDAVSDDWKGRKRGRPRKVSINTGDDDESDAVSDDCKKRKRGRPRKNFITYKGSVPQQKKKKDMSKVNMGSIVSIITRVCKVPYRRIHACDLCEYKTNRKSHLNTHILRHKKICNFKCDVCPYKSVTKWHLNIHILRHKGLCNFKCDFCPYKAVTKCALDRHRNNIHLNIRRFKCTLCMFATNRKDYLHMHVLNLHGNSKEAEIIVSQRQARSRTCARPKPSVCEICRCTITHTKMSKHSQMCPACCNTNNGQTPATQPAASTNINNGREELASDNLTTKSGQDSELEFVIKSEHDDSPILVRHPPKKLYKCKTCNFRTYALDNLNLHSCRKKQTS